MGARTAKARANVSAVASSAPTGSPELQADSAPSLKRRPSDIDAISDDGQGVAEASHAQSERGQFCIVLRELGRVHPPDPGDVRMFARSLCMHLGGEQQKRTRHGRLGVHGHHDAGARWDCDDAADRQSASGRQVIIVTDHHDPAYRAAAAAAGAHSYVLKEDMDALLPLLKG
jgi:hypothetical protein